MLSVLTTSALAAPAYDGCPKSCECTLKTDSTLALKCASTEFLEQLTHKQAQSISKIDLSRTNLSHVPKLKFLHQLKSLDLSHNSIKVVAVSSLPKTLESLDLSHNAFAELPENLFNVKHLRKVSFQRNHISCSCEHSSVLTYQKLVAKGVVFPKGIECASPEEKKGKHLSSLRCKQKPAGSSEEMQGDDPLSHFSPVEIWDDKSGNNEDEIENGFILEGSKKLESASLVLGENDEGSGDGDEHFWEPSFESTTAASEDYEGSGFIEEEHTEEVELTLPKICIFNCPTEDPIKESEEVPEGGSNKEAPSFFDLGKTLWDDLVGTTTSTPTEASVSDPAEEEVIVSKINKGKAFLPPVKEKDVELADKDKDLEEMDRQLTKPSDQANTAYIVVAALMILVVGLALYVMIKKRNKSARNRRESLEKDGKMNNKVEMNELLKKPPVEGNGDVPEKAPLINGQNGTGKVEGENDGDEVKVNGTNGGNAKTSTAKPDNCVDGYTPNDHDDLEDPANGDIQMRKKEDEQFLTPETKRVTVQALELSGPKTPLLVNRRLTDDGEIVTTPSADQRP